MVVVHVWGGGGRRSLMSGVAAVSSWCHHGMLCCCHIAPFIWLPHHPIGNMAPVSRCEKGWRMAVYTYLNEHNVAPHLHNSVNTENYFFARDMTYLPKRDIFPHPDNYGTLDKDALHLYS